MIVPHLLISYPMPKQIIGPLFCQIQDLRENVIYMGT